MCMCFVLACQGLQRLLELSYAVCMPAHMQKHRMELFEINPLTQQSNDLDGMCSVPRGSLQQVASSWAYLADKICTVHH